MLSAGLDLLTGGGTVYMAYQVYCQDVSVRHVVLLSTLAGLTSSIALQALAGTFSTEEPANRSLGGKIFSVLVRDFASFISGFVLPMAVAYGYLNKSGDLFNQYSLGLFNIEPRKMIGRWEISELFPVLVGCNFGFLVGQSASKIYAHLKKG